MTKKKLQIKRKKDNTQLEKKKTISKQNEFDIESPRHPTKLKLDS